MASNYEVGNLELSFKAMSDEAISSVEKIKEVLGGLQDTLEKVSQSTNKVTDNVVDMEKTFDNATNSAKEVEKALEDTEKQGKKTGATLGKAFNFGAMVYLGKKAFDMFDRGLAQSTDLISKYRMLEVSSANYFNQALDFQSKITSAFGVNSKDAMGVQAYFETLTSSLGMANAESNQMATTLTKLTYDLGSLFGEDFDSMYTKLQSGLIGQTKPLRSLGIDVTQQTIQGYLDAMGLDVMVQQLSQAEKVALRYIAILDQSRLAHGNLASSVEMPTHQIRVLKDQLREVSMWMYNAFMVTIGRILPYINGFVMAIKEMVKALAMLFGFELKNFGFGEFQKAPGIMDNIGASVGNIGNQAKKTSKELKKMMGLFGWDEIHNIQTPQEPTQPSGGAGGGVGGIGGAGVYDDLISALGDYDNLMGGVQMKAQKIRNNLLDWLGFLYDINAETGELENLRWGGFGEMATSAKILGTILVGFAGYKIWGLFSSLFKSKGFLLLGDTVKTFGAWLSLFVSEPLATIKYAFGSLYTAALPVFGLTASIFGAFKMFKWGKQVSENETLATSFWDLSLGMGASVAGGAALGSVIPGVGTLVGAIAGGIAGLTASLVGWSFDKPIKDVDNFKDVSRETIKVMKPFEDKFKEVDNTLKKLEWSKSIINEDDLKDIKGKLEDVGNYLNQDIIERTASAKKKIEEQDLFSGLDPNERNKLMERMDEASEKAQAKTEEINTKIYAIMKKASDEKRSLTQEETEIINGLQDQMYEHGVKTLSRNVEDQDNLFRNLKANTTKLSAEQASQIVQDSIQMKNKTVAEAQKRKDEEIAIATDLKERGIINKKQFDDMIKQSETDYNTLVEEAEKYHDDIIAEAQEHSGKYINHIDWENGEILNNFQATWGKIKTGWRDFTTGLGENLYEFVGTWKKGFNSIKDTVSNWFSDHVAPVFSLGNWKKLFAKALDGLKEGWRKVLNWFKEKVKFPQIKMPEIKFPKIKVPKFEVTGGSWNPVDWVTGKGGIPKINLGWNTYKTGGFPDGEDGFFANSSEMIGKFDNGKDVVANNEQITEGIARAVSRSMLDALTQADFGTSGGDVNVYMDSKLIAKHTKNKELERQFIRG